MQAAPACRMWIVAADVPVDETAEEMLARRADEDTHDHFNGWIVGVYSSHSKAIEQILTYNVGYTAHRSIPNVYVHMTSKHAVVLKIVCFDVDDMDE